MLRDNASQYTFGRSRSTIWPQGNGRMRVTGLSHSYLLKLFTRSIEPRRDGRVVEGTCLESRHTFTSIGGSNPPLSARTHIFLAFTSIPVWLKAHRFRNSPMRFRAEGKA